MNEQLLGAIIGASAAVVAQIVAAVVQAFGQQKQLKIAQSQLELAAAARYDDLSLEAFISMRDTIQALADGDIDPKSAYFKIRRNLIFLSDNDKKTVYHAIMSLLPPHSPSTSDRDETLSRALSTLELNAKEGRLRHEH